MIIIVLVCENNVPTGEATWFKDDDVKKAEAHFAKLAKEYMPEISTEELEDALDEGYVECDMKTVSIFWPSNSVV